MRWTIRRRKSGTRLSRSPRTCERRCRGRHGNWSVWRRTLRAGLSTRDIEDAFTDETGRKLLSRAAMNEVTEWAEYQSCKRDLAGHAIVYLFVDGIAAASAGRGARLCWPHGASARTDARSLLGLMAGSEEDVATLRAFFQDPGARGLGDPLLVVSEGAPGIIRVIEDAFPARRASAPAPLDAQPCRQGHDLTTDLWPEFQAWVVACRQACRRRSGDRAPTRGGHSRRLRRSPCRARSSRPFRSGRADVDELEEEIAAAGRDWEVAHLVDGERGIPGRGRCGSSSA